MNTNTNAKSKPNIYRINIATRVKNNQIICCHVCPFSQNNNIACCNDFIECEDCAKIVKLSCTRFCCIAWCCEVCVNNNASTNCAGASRNNQRHHNSPSNKMNAKTNDSTSLDVDK